MDLVFLKSFFLCQTNDKLRHIFTLEMSKDEYTFLVSL